MELVGAQLTFRVVLPLSANAGEGSAFQIIAQVNNTDPRATPPAAQQTGSPNTTPGSILMGCKHP